MERWARPARRESEDSLPRRTSNECCYEDLLTKTSWCNAEYAYREIERGRADGNKLALWWRAKIQSILFCIGCYIHLHRSKVIFVGALFLAVCGFGMKLAKLETNVEKLWVEEGGRLERELQYTFDTLGKGARSASQLIIQSPKHSEMNILTQEHIQLHLNVSLLATQVSVDMFDVTWKFKDICFVENFPSFETYADYIFENLMPCTIITPLDCFWEGSKLLGPENPIYIPQLDEPLVWTKTDPYALLEHPTLKSYFPEGIKDMLDDSGIGHGYQDRPCLNPYDPDCPSKAPNKISKEIPNFPSLMTGGCSGYAKEYMDWPEELIMGGIKKNESDHIISAEALETIFLLKSEKNMYDNWKNHQRVSHIKWTEEKAKEILDAWQKEFTKVVRNSEPNHPTQDVNAFSEASMNQVLAEFSETSLPDVIGGYLLMVLFAFLTMVKFTDGVKSQGGVGLLGVLLISATVVASLGFCAFIGIQFNASTTQVLPFLALGLGVDDMFLLVHSSASLPAEMPTLIKTGELLKRTGVCVFMTSLNNMGAFLLAAIIPIPALRSLCIQFAIIVVFNFLSVILIFPAILAVDLDRRDKKRVDIFCCLTSSSANRVVTIQPSPISDSPDLNRNRRNQQTPMETRITLHSTVETVTHIGDNVSDHCVTVVQPSTTMTCTTTPDGRDSSNMRTGVRSSSTRTLLRQDSVNEHVACWRDNRKKFKCWQWSLSGFVKKYYAPFLMNKFVKAFVILIFAGFLGVSVFGVMQVEDGLDLTDVVPTGTREQDFLQSRLKYFSYYDIYAVTMGDFDYPNNQKLLYEYHQEFRNIPEIIKNADGSLPKFWLDYFREWLLHIQEAFDMNKANGTLTQDGCHVTASDKGMIGYNLIIQTGEVLRPINTDLFHTQRLVDSEGIINPKAFYNYLTAWVNIDAMSYEVSQGAIHPSVPPIASHTLEKYCKSNVAAAKELNYTQLPFYVHDVYTTEDYIRLIKEVRNISERYAAKGIPNYPSGIPFTFWEQYIKLRHYLLLSLVCVFTSTFIIIGVLLFNPWAAFLLVLVLLMITVELFGFMGFIGVKMSAIPAVTLIISVGFGVEFTVHTLYAFLTSIGDHDRRVSMALASTFSPVLDGGISTLLGVVLLARSDFEIVVMYFFEVMSALVVIGLLNGLVLFPVILSIIGPDAEVRPHHQATRLSTPSPPPSPVPEHNYITRQYDKNRDFTGMSVSGMRDNRRRQMHEEHVEILRPEVVVENRLPKDYRTRRSSRRHSHRKSRRAHRDSRNFNTSMHSTPPIAQPRHETTVTTTSCVRIVHGCVDDIENQNFYQTEKEDDLKIEELEYNVDDDDSTL
ncbi:protein patched homolog 1-like [Antedon mediterranea]|uniref:protein patched homolog 1-like n=1 Tax=Antedon mediterranea TaxID=105859 RepID=UPI003AF71F5E